MKKLGFLIGVCSLLLGTNVYSFDMSGTNETVLSYDIDGKSYALENNVSLSFMVKSVDKLSIDLASEYARDNVNKEEFSDDISLSLGYQVMDYVSVAVVPAIAITDKGHGFNGSGVLGLSYEAGHLSIGDDNDFNYDIDGEAFTYTNTLALGYELEDIQLSIEDENEVVVADGDVSLTNELVISKTIASNKKTSLSVSLINEFIPSFDGGDIGDVITLEPAVSYKQLDFILGFNLGVSPEITKSVHGVVGINF